MLDIPFQLQSIPAANADSALAQLARERTDSVPVLLGDADIFSAEWAEIVDIFEPPENVLEEAMNLDIDAWFDKQVVADATATKHMNGFNFFYRIVAFPFDVVLFPIRLARWPLTGRRPILLSRSPFDEHTVDQDEDAWIEMLKQQLAEFEAGGEATEEELVEIRQTIAQIEAEGIRLFPDPIAYVTPRHSTSLAAALLKVDAPWQAAAWLQHGTYSLCTPRAVFVAHCKWLAEKHGAQIITASTDAIGFQMERPIATREEAEEVLRRFSALGATEVNADHRGTDGSSLVDAERLWVWWD